MAALASLGQLLPLLPTSLATGQKPNLLAHFVSTAKPQAQLAGVRVPVALCAPRLSGHLAAMRHRQRQQRRQQQRAAEAREQSYQQAVQDLVQEADAVVESELHKAVQDADTATGSSDSAPGSSDSAAATAGSSSSSSDTAVAAAAPAEEPGGSDAAGEQQDAATDRWLLGTANDTPVGVDESEGVTAAGADDVSTGVSDVASGPSAGVVQQQQQQKAPAPAAGTAGAELPCACALHIGKVRDGLLDIWAQNQVHPTHPSTQSVTCRVRSCTAVGSCTCATSREYIIIVLHALDHRCVLLTSKAGAHCFLRATTACIVSVCCFSDWCCCVVLDIGRPSCRPRLLAAAARGLS